MKEDQSSSIPGEQLLIDVMDEGVACLSDDDTSNVYKASLVGGQLGAVRIIAADERVRQQWGSGTREQATRIIEVWGEVDPKNWTGS